MREYSGLTRPVYEVGFVPGARPRLAALTDGGVYLWDLDRPEPTGVLSAKLSSGRPGWEYEYPVLAASPNGRWLAAGPTDRVRVWDLTRSTAAPAALPVAGRLVTAAFPRGDGRLLTVYRTWARAGANLVAGRFPFGARRQAPDSPTVLELPAQFVSSGRAVHSGSYAKSLSADGRRLASAPDTYEAHVWDVESGKWIGIIEAGRSPFELSCSPDGSQVAVDQGTAVFLHDAVTLEPLATWKVPSRGNSRMAWSPDGRFLARTNEGTTAWVYEVETGREVAALRAGRVGLTCVAFAPDGLTFATGTADGRVRVWDVDGG